MVPSAFVLLAALPCTPNGKIDRRALPLPEQFGTDHAVSFVAPRTPIEELLVAIWGELLGHTRIGVQDNFFEIGGHSLLAMRVLARVRIAFDVEVPLRVLFEMPTVAALAERVETIRWAMQAAPAESLEDDYEVGEL